MAILWYITYSIALGNNLYILNEREHPNSRHHHWCLSLRVFFRSSFEDRVSFSLTVSLLWPPIILSLPPCPAPPCPAPPCPAALPSAALPSAALPSAALPSAALPSAALVYWPGIGKDIERLVSDCAACQEYRNVPTSMELHPWEWPDKPWSRLHADFAGLFLGHMFLILVDAHSKWMDIYIMFSITSEAAISNLKASFFTHGLPDVLVTDNGPSFKSESYR